MFYHSDSPNNSAENIDGHSTKKQNKKPDFWSNKSEDHQLNEVMWNFL